MALDFRNYQTEADDACYDELVVRKKNRALVKMFCGTGKSRLMRWSKLNRGKKRVVYVFPSLSLIDQFCRDYLSDVPGTVLQISSELEATTDPTLIKQFLSKPEPLIICVTYQSFNTLLDNLGETKIDVCHYDEAHHAVGETYQKLIFENTVCEKQIFYTATPKNANGVVMYDRDNVDTMCGKLVYDYSYLRGVREGYLNPIEIRVDMFMENTNKSLYESMARAVLASGNGRVLTFHADVNTDRPTSVLNFVNQAEFIQVFQEVQRREFPKSVIQKIRMFGITAAMNGRERRDILDLFDSTSDDEVIVISSCETIGEGIDTKSANMCVFVDPKSSYVKIIQNIGRIVRKMKGRDKASTVLIPCWVDKAKYMDCNGDKEKCDEVIRQDMNEGGNFNGILNVLSALKQEDEDIYDICLNYPQAYSPSEMVSHLESQGYTIGEPGELQETMEYLLDEEVDGDDLDLEDIAQERDVCIEVVNHSLDKPVERYNEGCEDIVRVYETDDGYCPLLKEESKRHREPLSEPNRANRVHFKVHTHPDVQVLWKITGDMSADICSCVLDCEVVKYSEEYLEEYWLSNHKKMCDFIDSNGQIPIKENSLYNWINTQKSNYKKKKERMSRLNIRIIWEESLEKYPCLRTLNEQWILKHTELCLYLDEHKSLPLRKEHYVLVKWLERQSINYDQKIQIMSDKDIRKIWEETLEKYPCISVDSNDKWKQHLTNMVAYIETHKMPPTLSENRNMYNWISTQKSNYKNSEYIMSNPKIRKMWEDAVQKYPCLSDLDEKWKQKLDELCKHINKYGKMSKEHGRWVTRQRILYNTSEQIMSKLEIRKLWEDAVQKYPCLSDLDEKWNQKLQALCEYIDKESVIPPQTVSIGRWVCTQKKNYKNCKCIMKKNADVRKMWEDTVQKYPCLKDNHKRTKKSMKLKETVPKETVPKESAEQKRERELSDLSQRHKIYKSKTSVNLRYHFGQHPEDWHSYHALAEANEASFPTEQIPRNRVIQLLEKLKAKNTIHVVDMGCGHAQIAEHFRGDKQFEFTNFDHVSSSDSVISCDISNTGLEDDSVDICILSLAMWGSNCKAYIQEAFRILESRGILYIVEATKRWTDKDEHGNIILEKKGQKLKTLLEANGFKIVQEDIEKFCLLTCYKV